MNNKKFLNDETSKLKVARLCYLQKGAQAMPACRNDDPLECYHKVKIGAIYRTLNCQSS